MITLPMSSMLPVYATCTCTCLMRHGKTAYVRILYLAHGYLHACLQVVYLECISRTVMYAMSDNNT